MRSITLKLTLTFLAVSLAGVALVAAIIWGTTSVAFNQFLLDRSSRDVRVGDRKVSLTPTEFDLLALLMTSPGRVYSRLDLLELLQDTSFEGVARTIDVHIRNLRTKIEPDAANPRYVETVYGAGYRLARQP